MAASSQSKSFQQEIDDVVCDFHHEDYLGKGGCSTADLYTVSRKVVIKRTDLNSEIFEDPQMQKLAENEAKLMTRLSHPHIVRVYHAWKDSEKNILNMELEYCVGGSLRKLINEQRRQATPFPIPRIQPWIAQLSTAIAYIHDLHIAHRDLSPDNILLTADHSAVKIADFGVAKLHETGAMTSQFFVGKPVYIAPEAGDPGLKQNRFPLDVWALGVIAYELATLDLPTRGFQTFDQERIDQLVAENIRPDTLRNLLGTKLLIKKWESRATMTQVLMHAFVEPVASIIANEHSDYLYKQISGLAAEVKRHLSSIETDTPQNSPSNSESPALPASTPVANAALLSPVKISPPKYIQELFDFKSLENVKQLVEQGGADINATNQKESSNNGTVLFYAARRGCADVVKYLTDNGSDLELAEKNGVTPLMAACQAGHLDVVKILIEKGANVDAISKPGNTPLILAACNGHEKIIQILLDRNPVTLNHKAQNGKSALQSAIDKNLMNTVLLLKDKEREIADKLPVKTKPL